MNRRQLKTLVGVALLTVYLPACAALGGAAAIGGGIGAVADVAKSYIDYKREGKRPHGLVPEDFSQLRLGMPDADVRQSVGNPSQTTMTPEGWTCYTYSPVLRAGGKASRSMDYSDQYRVLMVDRGDGLRVAGWATSNYGVLHVNCAGL